MADLSKIKIGSLTYNIKDSQARSDIAEHSSQISALGTDVTNLEAADTQIKNMISNSWTQRTWTTGEYCIYDNKLWECLVDNSDAPSEGVNWREISITDIGCYQPGDIVTIGELRLPVCGFITSSQKR